MKEGDYILVTTSTVNDVFGRVIYKILELTEERARCEMKGGSGEAARDGMIINQPVDELITLISNKTATIIPEDKAKAMAVSFANARKNEIEW